MAGLSLSVRVDDFKARAVLDRLSDLDLRPVFDGIGEYLTSETARRFDRSEDADGKSLEPSRRALSDGGKTLVDRGRLRNSFVYRLLAGERGVEFGSNVIYSAIHQFGGNAGRGGRVKLPPRPILGINPADEREIDDIVFDEIKRQLRT